MPLTNTQYDQILHQYEEKQAKTRREMEQKLSYVYQHVPGYQDLAEAVASVSVAQGRKLLAGDEEALEDLKDTLAELSGRKAQLLKDFGLPENYLEPVYECPDCKDTGYIDGDKCHCFKQAMITLLYEQSNIQEMLRTENFNALSFEYYQGEDLSRFQNAVRTCQNFIKNFNSDYHNLFFYGTVGTGKSFLSGCIANELIKRGHSVIYFSALNLFECLAYYSFDSKEKSKLHSFYEDIYGCDLLVIDDLGTETTNAFINSQLFACLNERQLRRNATVISTNLNLEELQARYSDRIFSRLTSNFTFCKLTGADIRISRL